MRSCERLPRPRSIQSTTITTISREPGQRDGAAQHQPVLEPQARAQRSNQASRSPMKYVA